MARHPELGPGAGPHESRQDVIEPVAGAKGLIVFACLGHSDFAGKMALLADAVSLARRELGRIEHRFAKSNVIAARTMASLAGYPAFQKRRRGIGVLRAWNPLNSTGVT